MRHRRTKFILVIAGLVLSSSSIAQTRNDDLNCDSTCLVPGAMGNIQPNTNTASTGPQTMPGRIVSCQTPTKETTTGYCPSGQTGSINYSRSVQLCSDGVTGTYNYGSWTETSRSCYTPPPPPPADYGPSCPYRNQVVPYSTMLIITTSNPQCGAICSGAGQNICQIF